MERVRGELAVRHGREPAEEEVAAARPPLSLDEAFHGDEEEPRRGHLLSDAGATAPGEGADRRLLKRRIAEVLRGLTPRDRGVIELRFGLRDGQPRTLEEVARVFGVTRERVRQLEQRGLDRLREPGRRNRLAGFAEAEDFRV
jgi:RNA polymerase primary sigma factor